MKDKTIIKVSVKPWKVGKGHSPHKSGSGNHGDCRLKRLKTRSNQKRSAIADSY